MGDHTRKEIEKRMDELARQYAETHGQEVKAELEALSLRLAGLPTQQVQRAELVPWLLL
jgi:FKBP-type peptidyl-prolyl cis-trans isomerase (trigger factor)